MRQQAENLVRAVSAFRLTLDERVTPQHAAPADLRETQREAAPRAIQRSKPARVTAKVATTAAAATTASDDWEEF
jgi:hypothetical protein